MQHKSWPDLCESLLDRLEAKGENTTTERAEFGVLVAECGSSGCKNGIEPERRKTQMAIKAYSLAKDGNKKLSANFAVKEFRCKDGTDPIFIDDVLVKLLQNIRNHFGKAVTITSAYRTAAHNKAVKGATYSQHCYGMAADIRIQGVDVETLATYAETLLKNTGGIGRYPVKTGRPAGWVHIDTRAVKSRWVG